MGERDDADSLQSDCDELLLLLLLLDEEVELDRSCFRSASTASTIFKIK